MVILSILKISAFLVWKDVKIAKIQSIVLNVKLVIFWLKNFDARNVKVVKNAYKNKILWFVFHVIVEHF